MNSFHKKYTEQLYQNYPELKNEPSPFDFTTLVSPYQIELSFKTFQRITQSIRCLYQMSHQPFYKDIITSPEIDLLNYNIPNQSVLMAYDFHITPEGQAKLIEINTNGAGFLFVDELYKFKSLVPPIQTKPLEALISSFKEESLKFHDHEPQKIAIIDENLHEQKMFPEFIMYKSLFQKQGWDSVICDYKDLKYKDIENKIYYQNTPIDFIYNRYCDFLLKETSSQSLLSAFKNKAAVFSPNPVEYLLLADKNRMLDWTRSLAIIENHLNPEDFESIQNIFIKTLDLAQAPSQDEIWSQRKDLFFKPKRSHGGKATYKGKNISRKMFESVFNEDFIAQEYIPAPTVELEGQTWKYDLRFYVYQGEVQNICARLYQGQVTNFKTVNGGFVPIILKD